MSTATITSTDITGLILAGGRGSRMGGVDKGLQSHRGQPLVRHALQRLGPQVGQLMINANRNLEAYEALGVPVWPDAEAGYPGPLAGLLVGLARCGTPYLVSVPCDTPNFPLDLVGRLARALVAEGAELAMAATREPDAQGQPVLQLQPVFCLLGADLKDSLAAFLQSGQRKIDRWTAQHRCATVVFDDTTAFANANTPEELQALQGGAGGAMPA